MRGRRAASVLVLVGVLAGCGQSLLPEPVTEQGERSADLWRVFLWVAFIIFVLIYGLVAVAVIRFRRRRSDDTIPTQLQDRFKLEVLWTAIPLVIVAVLFGLSVFVERDVTSLSDEPDLVVEVQGFQWQWQFRYPASGIVVTGVPGSKPALVLPTDRTVRLRLVSDDVIHSFWVPNFIEKRDLIPGVTNEIDVNLTQAGEWNGVCSEFCGLDHWKMTFTVRALDPAAFDQWIASGGQTS